MPASQRSVVAQSVVRACSLLKVFRYEGELLQLRDFVVRTSYHKTTVHRLLQSLEAGGLLERVGSDHYRLQIKPVGTQPVRIGFATRGTQSPFSRDVTECVHEHAFELVRRHLHRVGDRRTVVAASNDPMALGALRAFEESGGVEHCAIMGQNASPEAREEIRRSGTRLIGSVVYFPEHYGSNVIRIALSMLSGKPTADAVFTNHQLITAANVDLLYPLDDCQPAL
jgi:IclR helix-turn-helix domain